MQNTMKDLIILIGCLIVCIILLIHYLVIIIRVEKFNDIDLLCSFSDTGWDLVNVLTLGLPVLCFYIILLISRLI